jgi:beta-glucosidase
MINRRAVIGAGVAATAVLAASPAVAAKKQLAAATTFPQGFMWGAATAGHQIEGNNVHSDTWFLENTKPTVFAEPSRDAADSFHRWHEDMDLAKGMGLNSYRFSIEWARIEPEQGLFSNAMLDHYKRMIAGAHDRGLKPIVTFNHFTSPHWFAVMGGWTNADAPALFANFCTKAAAHFADGIDHAITFNEPNIMRILKVLGLPPQVWDIQRAMLNAAARHSGSATYSALNAANLEDVDAMQVRLQEGHRQGKAAIKAVRGDLPVGFSLAMFDDQAAGKNSIRDQRRTELYGGWLELARSDDFMGVQNYERVMWDAKGKLPPPPGSDVNYMGAEVYPPSLAGAVRYAHAMTKVPIFVTEHGVGTTDDNVRARLIPAALADLKKLMDQGVPVKGYCHWSLIDNFEWIFGYRVKFGLHSVDPVTFVRTAKPSAAVFAAIAKRNGL